MAKSEARKRQEAQRNRAIIVKAKDKPCADCRKRYPFWVMQFDHVRGTKKFNLSQAYRKGHAAVLAEIAKCEVVCANCRAERTWRRQEATQDAALRRLWDDYADGLVED